MLRIKERIKNKETIDRIQRLYTAVNQLQSVKRMLNINPHDTGLQKKRDSRLMKLLNELPEHVGGICAFGGKACRNRFKSFWTMEDVRIHIESLEKSVE